MGAIKLAKNSDHHAVVTIMLQWATLPFVAILLMAGLFMAYPAASIQSAAMQQTLVIEEQSFEGEVFPPPGWAVYDANALEEELPAQLTWGRETCDVPDGHGDAAAWAAGGGEVGEDLDCLEPYPGPIYSVLSFGPIDATNFSGGLSVNLHLKLDAPSPGSFTICAATAEGDLACFGTGLAETDWVTFEEPGLEFPAAAGEEGVYVQFRYTDLLPLDPHFGALVDAIVIRGEGVTGATMTPTSTATTTSGAQATATPSPTVGVTQTPSPTLTPGSSPTAGATATDDPAASATPTVTGTAEASPTAEATATDGPSPTSTATPTDGPAPTVTSTVDITHTAEPGNTAEATPTEQTESHVIYLPFAQVQH